MNQIIENQLAKLLSFTDENVISRFMDMYDVPQTEAQDILLETLKFLHISQIPGIFIPDDLLIVDEMWHNLILFTPLYHKFSVKYFNTPYFHHLPATKAEKNQRKEDIRINPDKARKKYLKKLEFLLSTTYDYFGAETVEKWFKVYPEKYSKENIKKLRK
ncbi:hypothetical protein [Algibacter lectus]|uniref:Uncharacterized protein n=1 Tax=Algibacter lectus TaxID=221126 RepID=A0A090W860_9FLAO|nr:hypothetical protein [Algibacter lectus]GAL63722.1 hypothetical protein JCM19300_2758 [Algibacter lectus]SFB90363.1 hypothetical protein SAMN04489722_101222 [Algibacter lectus]